MGPFGRRMNSRGGHHHHMDHGFGHGFGHNFPMGGHFGLEPEPWMHWPHGRPFKRSDSSSSSSSSSSSDSEDKKGKKKMKKCMKKWAKGGKRHWKRWGKVYGKFMTQPVTHCALCWRQIRPLADTEVLDCGHIYHRQCLKELFAVSRTEEQTDVFCTQCRQQIDPELAQQLQNRFNEETATDQPMSPSTQVTRDMGDLNVA